MTKTGLPLEGVRVVEMTHMVMGPTCGMILAQLGAEVIKVEPPQGDKTRSLGGMDFVLPAVQPRQTQRRAGFRQGRRPRDHAPAARDRRRVFGELS